MYKKYILRSAPTLFFYPFLLLSHPPPVENSSHFFPTHSSRKLILLNCQVYLDFFLEQVSRYMYISLSPLYKRYHAVFIIWINHGLFSHSPVCSHINCLVVSSILLLTNGAAMNNVMHMYFCWEYIQQKFL